MFIDRGDLNSMHSFNDGDFYGTTDTYVLQSNTLLAKLYVSSNSGNATGIRLAL